MRRQLAKGFAMLVMIVVLALASAVVSANGQTPKTVTAKVPFDFIVGSTELPAGDYSVRPITNGNGAVLIKSDNGKSSAMRLTDAIEPQGQTEARLVFHRYGERYFLADVWLGTDSEGRQLRKSRHESAMERELAAIAANQRSGYAIVKIAATLQ
jgi:hypothetical protein